MSIYIGEKLNSANRRTISGRIARRDVTLFVGCDNPGFFRIAQRGEDARIQGLNGKHGLRCL